ncbi:methylated-DNA--[protein]-cysteine S-methyltransferase [Caldimonas tepidiphila]|uniref:methylated-DNA--[protein]-cysteine S-methyltransferase n=1 Tax=Caldimonas tepidiphila TaxID=2315841 RepID=UPI00196B0D47|nr:methylated-DNA--[protein]-cysteine S-methyltransferase [Caldimonas tepidiphila]
MDEDTLPGVEARHYEQVAKAIGYLRANALRQPPLVEVAAAVGLSEHHLQRVFSEWAGVSPKRFLQSLTKAHALAALRASADVLDAALASGLSGPGRLHDLIVSCEAMTPGEVRALGAGLEIGHGFAATPFGEALLGWTPRGLCHLEFRDGTREALLAALRSLWPHATLRRDDAGAAALAGQVFPRLPAPRRLHLVLRGTNFQIQVWEALLRTRPGQLLSYAQLAAMAGLPRAPRAVGSAVGANTLGVLIPCHRVIRGSGDCSDYRWGVVRKLALQGWEAARAAAVAEAGR